MIWEGQYIESIQKSIDSFARFHKVNLWSYTDQNYKNCTLKDSNEVYPKDNLPTFNNKQSLSDFLRLHIIYKFGGWYSDCDNICLSKLDIKDDIVLTYFNGAEGDINNSIFKFPKKSSILKNVIDSYDYTLLPAYLYFSKMLRDSGLNYINSNILHFRGDEVYMLDKNITKIVHLFNSCDGDKNLKIINQIYVRS
jgi:mannosyltransferase OCH1-like enzyme